ncbi:hypothetical protein EAI_05133 [Harpegnathos saltator]|uniref:Uncharacterized protein n=1 Tax=Harpegnathos saltator TaxID=610380 RepID=E2BQ02_HARSA|nr:hypothetical protein EAI_05133 [Harpegnathos saltator]
MRTLEPLAGLVGDLQGKAHEKITNVSQPKVHHPAARDTIKDIKGMRTASPVWRSRNHLNRTGVEGEMHDDTGIRIQEKSTNCVGEQCSTPVTRGILENNDLIVTHQPSARVAMARLLRGFNSD